MTIRGPYKKAIPIETSEFCKFGCGQIAKFKNNSGTLTCEVTSNRCPENRKKNSVGLVKAHIDEKLPGWTKLRNEYGIDTAWSRGLTKEIDVRLARPTLVGKAWGAGITGHSLEMKQILSDIRIHTLENSPHVKWMILPNGIKVQGSWEYNVGQKLINDGFILSRIRLKYDGHHQYTPDFCIGLDTYVEVKGWLSDRDITKYTKVLNDHPKIKIYLIRDEGKRNNYKKFTKGLIELNDCEDLREVIMGD